MNSDVKKFLESGLLEAYLLGSTDAEQTRTVERYLADSPEVQAEFEAIQDAIERAAKEMATVPPTSLRSDILQKIDALAAADAKVVQLPRRRPWLMVASVAALVCGALALYFYGKTSGLENEKDSVLAEVAQLQTTLAAQQADCQTIENQLNLLLSPGTEKFILQGNAKAPQFELIAYWNETEQRTLALPAALPELPGKQCYQLWADVDGEMVSMGVLPSGQAGLLDLPFMPRATSLNVTIEPAGGSEHPTVADLVASVSI